MHKMLLRLLEVISIQSSSFGEGEKKEKLQLALAAQEKRRYKNCTVNYAYY